MKNIIYKSFIYYLAIFIFFNTYFIKHYFGLPTVEQIFFHVIFVIKEYDGVPGLYVWLYKKILKRIALYTLLLVSVEFLLPIIGNYIYKIKIHFITILYNFIKNIFSKLAIILLFSSVIYFGYTFSLHKIIAHKISIIYPLSKNYVDPKNVKIFAKSPKNLVLIYLESVEDTFQDSNIFGQNLLKEITDIKSINFKKYKQLPEAGWTIAGQFATQCGMLINNGFTDYNNLCLSDILSQNGYYNVYLQGNSLDFTSTRKFLKKHHYDEVFGLEEWKSKGVTNISKCDSIYDEDIFIKAKQQIKDLYKKKKLFNLTILTGDTHDPGFPSPSCNIMNHDDIPAIVKCSSRQVADFIQFIKENGYDKDTNIVIIGDHLFHKDSTLNDISKSERSIFNRFISQDNYQTNSEEILHVDMLPSILTFIGFEVEGERLGLGQNKFKEKK